MPQAETARIAILMGTYHGAAHLRAQLDSILAQTYPHWFLVVSDDGSTDATLTILQEYQTRLGAEKLRMVRGPRRGFAANFLSLICDTNIDAEYFAFADQDDVWMADKLAASVAALADVAPATPALYGSRTVLTDAEGNATGLSPLFSKPAGFRNALVQCIAGGNSMVLNRAARDLLASAGADVEVIGHDWWSYLAVSGCGGVVVYDPTPRLYYRQHRKNLMGSNVGLLSRLLRVRLLFAGKFVQWNTQNIAALSRLSSQLTPENAALLAAFAQARARRFLPRVFGFLRVGIYRQTLLGNCGLIAAACCKKI